MWLRHRKTQSDSPSPQLVLARRFDDHGMVIEEVRSDHGLMAETASLLVQLEDEGLASAGDDHFRLDWRQLYRLIDHKDYRKDLALLDMPPVGGAVPRLISRGSLTDANFIIAIDGWFTPDRQRLGTISPRGALLEIGGEPELLSQPAWNLLCLVQQFARRNDEDRNEHFHRRAWGEIRAEALKAGALLDDFLYRTVVLVPDRLRFTLRRGQGGVVEVEPGFDGAPENWLKAFDGSRQVLERYDLPTIDGIIQVVTSAQIKNVLAQVKAMPGRRVAGARAEAFLLNPVAALGADAAQVIDTDAFEMAKEDAGIIFDRFSAWSKHGAAGLNITTPSTQGIDSSRLELAEEEAISFADLVDARIAAGMQLCAWRDYEFELDGDSAAECQKLRDAYAIPAANKVLVRYDDIHDLSGYSERIAEIGIEKPIYSPYIVKKSDDEGWFPQNIEQVIGWTPPGAEAPVGVVVTPELKKTIQQRVDQATAVGQSTITIPGCPVLVPVDEAKAILATLDDELPKRPSGELDLPPKAPQERSAKLGLVLKSNIDCIDYTEERRALLACDGTIQPVLPSSLRPEITLMDHQLAGVAWMQRLLTYAPQECRGALLADDMGLGKTLQLLCLITAAREHDPSLPPALVVAPLSLLENWKDEAERFFQPGAIRLLTAYGSKLAELRLPQNVIDQELRNEGLVRFLRPDWRHGADIVLTTYETLRDMEFSFAREKWSIMVCDEAQKIKNPAAKLTTAAKKQQTLFRIACTGTPVENSLADLWCLFDFVQPGLLGALNEFGKNYRRPIEAANDVEREKVEELRALVAPQILRRMKSDVATDLKAKIINADCLSLPLSDLQRALYTSAVEQYHARNEPGAVTAFSNQLGLLHHLRLICTDPQRHGLETFVPEALSAYRAKAPKLDWLVNVLTDIKTRNEKAIIFCEFKNIQRLLRHYIQVGFGIAADIINGDTSASADNVESRQKRIKVFQQRPGFGVIILSPVAVGFGVNIQAANHVIHYTRTWNPAKEDQATDRAYRIGQTRDVHVYCPTVMADDFKTFDVKLDELLNRKRELAVDMLNGAGDVGIGDFGIDQIVPGGSAKIDDTLITLDDVLRMNPMTFECLAAALCVAQGWRSVSRTQRNADAGVDVVAHSGDLGMLIQCKSSGSDRALNWDAVKEVVGGRALYDRLYPSTTFSLACFTNTEFNPYARDQARLNNVKLVEREDIATLLDQHPLRFSDVERFLHQR